MSTRPPYPVVIAARQWCGLFSMIFQAVGMARVIKARGGTPIVCFGRDTCFWDPGGYHHRYNAWEYFFLPVAGYSMLDLGIPDDEAADLRLTELRARLPDVQVTAEYPWDEVGAFGMPGKITPVQFAHLTDAFDRYLRVRPEIRARVDEVFVKSFAGHDAVGVHFRGNDKWIEAPPVHPDRYWKALDTEFATAVSSRAYVATDSAWFAAEAERRYGDRVVVTRDVLREDRPVGVHFTGGSRAAEEALIDALVLARCRILYHGTSNLAGGVLAMSPMMQRVDLSKTGRDGEV